MKTHIYSDLSEKRTATRKKPIAKPDFFFERQHIAIFVDGPAHDMDYVQRDDENKRKKLRELGYRVFVIRYDNLEEDIEMLRRALI